MDTPGVAGFDEGAWEVASDRLAAMMRRLPEMEGKRARLQRAHDARAVLEVHFKRGYAQRTGSAQVAASLDADMRTALERGGFDSIDQAMQARLDEGACDALDRELNAFDVAYKRLLWECERLDARAQGEGAPA